MKKILVIGSYNVGLSIVGDRMPTSGETVMSRHFEMGPGGKGSNQAIALCRLGAETKFICCLGDDHFGKDAIRLFKKEGVSMEGIKMRAGCHTGVGIILVDKYGHNAISVAPGANYQLAEEDLLLHMLLFQESQYLLIQLETPMPTVKSAIRLAKQHNSTVIFNPAPAQEIDAQTLRLADFITPNESEAMILSGIPVSDVDSARLAGEKLVSAGARNVIITLGDKGCMLVTKQRHQHFPAFTVDAIDSTGAGDAFNSGFAFALSKGDTVDAAIRFASKVAALSVTRAGAVNGLPTLDQVLEFETNYQS